MRFRRYTRGLGWTEVIINLAQLAESEDCSVEDAELLVKQFCADAIGRDFTVFDRSYKSSYHRIAVADAASATALSLRFNATPVGYT